MSHDELPDLQLRGRLHAAACAEPAELDDAAHARIAAVLAAGALRRRRARRFRLLGAGSLGVAAAAAFALYRPAPQAIVAPQRVCALPTGGLVVERREGLVRLAIPGHGDLVGAEGAELTLIAAQPCVLHVAVRAGTVGVDVHDLNPGRLVLSTPHGDVNVRGTQFSVEVAESLAVHLVSGAVDIADGAQRFPLAAGHTLRHRRAADVSTSPLSDGDRARVAGVLSLRSAFSRAELSASQPAPVAADSPAKSASSRGRDFLALAEGARQRGEERIARRYFEQAIHAPAADAEVALLRWARFELAVGRLKTARGLLVRHRRDFPRGVLGAEALWLATSIAEAEQRPSDARRSAAELVQKFPQAPQAEAARKLLARP